MPLKLFLLAVNFVMIMTIHADATTRKNFNAVANNRARTDKDTRLNAAIFSNNDVFADLIFSTNIEPFLSVCGKFFS